MKKPFLAILFVALVLAAILSPFASSSPDGLERVAEDLGFIEKGEKAVLSAPIPDYLFPGIENEAVATALAGLLGTLLTFGAMYGLAKVVSVKKKA